MHLIVTAERKFWRCVESGEPPRRLALSRRSRGSKRFVWSNERVEFLAEFAGIFRSTRQAFLEHERSKAELKALMPEDAKEAIGHGLRAKWLKSGAITFL